MRYDFFITWGNGLNHLAGIHNIIRQDDNFQIVRVSRIAIKDMGRFIEDIYACDTVPIEHLRGKTQYLLNSPPMAFFTLVKNHHPDEQYFGEGEFRHIQCTKVKKLKEEIRNAFNPRFQDPNHTVPPLNPGVSHEHCIHASDYESQVEYILNLFKMGDISYYEKNAQLGFPQITWHVDLTGKKVNVVERKVDDLFINLVDKGLVKIQDSPHYQYVNGNKTPYVRYIESNLGISLQEDHFLENFDKLLNNFSLSYIEKNKSYVLIGKNNQVIDGAHRVCIIKKLGVDTIKCFEAVENTGE